MSENNEEVSCVNLREYIWLDNSLPQADLNIITDSFGKQWSVALLRANTALGQGSIHFKTFIIIFVY